MKKLFILIPILLLNIISLFYLSNTEYLTKQLSYIIIGYILLFLSYKINYKYIIKLLKPIYIINIFLLLLVLIIGKEINGSKAWLHIFNISIQPSEITKLVLLLTLPYLVNKKKPLLTLPILTIIPSLLTFLEPDTGAIIIYIIILLSSIRFTRIKKQYIIIFILLIIAFITTNLSLYFYNKDIIISIYGNKLFYRIDRLTSFLNKDNIQNIYSLISIGSNNLLYIPENHNDFIFASIISKYNILITIILITSISTIIIYLINITNKKRTIDNIYNYTLLNILLFSFFYNILMNLSLLPIIGIPLPFVSYGGSYLLILYLMIGFSINPSKNMVLEDKKVEDTLVEDTLDN
ncbi:MAG: FtsW/RodA/SpoVE family cell cycle protein [Candidatus Coprovivens sp.]